MADLGAPTQLRVRAGDVVLLHSETGHCGGPHLGHDIRSMLYYRVRHSEWADMVEKEAMAADMWVDLEGVASLPEAQACKHGTEYVYPKDD